MRARVVDLLLAQLGTVSNDIVEVFVELVSALPA